MTRPEVADKDKSPPSQAGPSPEKNFNIAYTQMSDYEKIEQNVQNLLVHVTKQQSAEGPRTEPATQMMKTSCQMACALKQDLEPQVYRGEDKFDLLPARYFSDPASTFTVALTYGLWFFRPHLKIEQRGDKCSSCEAILKEDHLANSSNHNFLTEDDLNKVKMTQNVMLLPIDHIKLLIRADANLINWLNFQSRADRAHITESQFTAESRKLFQTDAQVEDRRLAWKMFLQSVDNDCVNYEVTCEDILDRKLAKIRKEKVQALLERITRDGEKKFYPVASKSSKVLKPERFCKHLIETAEAIQQTLRPQMSQSFGELNLLPDHYFSNVKFDYNIKLMYDLWLFQKFVRVSYQSNLIRRSCEELFKQHLITKAGALAPEDLALTFRNVQKETERKKNSITIPSALIKKIIEADVNLGVLINFKARQAKLKEDASSNGVTDLNAEISALLKLDEHVEKRYLGWERFWRSVDEIQAARAEAAGPPAGPSAGVKAKPTAGPAHLPASSAKNQLHPASSRMPTSETASQSGAEILRGILSLTPKKST